MIRVICWVGMQQPGLSRAWETDVGAAPLPPGPMESSDAAEKWPVCPVGVEGGFGVMASFSLPLKSHLLCLDYYFGKRLV